ncbi:MAG: hypothetical protein DI573_07450 [Microbacterium sp.]|uniref:hypothetical protein n=1 Tax=Microbacterium sp. TaxID=51671 RepID=UPI000DB4B076|nr:hypothetical protein [Microbacterium sp.]PZU39304.1 MAG: hypothetical protein DI573_07450 [Microbacterium sp.]
MPRLTTAELRRRIDALEAENAALRERAAHAEDAADTLVLDAPADTEAPRRRAWGWTLLATVLITLGALLAPIAVVATWANVQLTDTDRFVAAYGPLADDPAVQAVVADQVDLGTGPAATRALELLKGPAAQGVQSLIDRTVEGFVASDAFSNVWATALRVSHTQLTGALAGEEGMALDLADDGTIGIQLAPIIDAVKDALVAQGIGLAASIPTIDRTIAIAQSDALPSVQLGYGLTLAAGLWLPWIAIGLLAAGVLVARRRSVALVAASVALALSMVIVVAGFAIGRIVFIATVTPDPLPARAAEVLFATFTGAMRDTAVAVLVLAIVVALVGWFTGPFRVPRRLRGLVHSGAGSLRDVLERRGLRTGRVGVWLYRQRVLMRAAVAVIAAAVVLFVRPLTPGLVIWTLVIAALVVLVLEVIERPAPDPAAAPLDESVA